MLLMNLLLALAWLMLTNDTSVWNFLLGAALGFVVLGLAERPFRGSRYFARVANTLIFAGVFFLELIKANLRVAADVVTARHRMHPAVIAMPLEGETDIEIVILAILITLTPGQLALDLSSDRRVMYVHTMYAEEEEEERRRFKEGLERRLLEITR